MSFQKRSRKKKLALTLGLVPFLVGGVVSPVTAAEITETITSLGSLPSGLKSSNNFVYAEDGKLTIRLAADATVFTGLPINKLSGGYDSGYSDITYCCLSFEQGQFSSADYNYIYGGYSANGSAIGNVVNISGGTITAQHNFIFGGYSNNGSAIGNVVNITGGSISAEYNDICGCYSWSSANNNTVNISGGTISAQKNSIYGGYSANSYANNNTVNISGGTISVNISGASDTKNNYIYGGYSANGSANNNTVNISGGTISVNISGGTSSPQPKNNSIFGGCAYNGSAIGNVVNITGGQIDASVNNDIFGGCAYNGSAIGNVVNITGGSITASENNYIYGGYSKVAASDNIVNIALSNNLMLSGNTYDTSIYGGFGYDGGNATNNKVYLFNPDGNKKIFEKITGVYGGSAAGTATNNSVIIGKDINGVVYNNPINMSNAEIHGGHSDAGNTNDNTLEIYSTGNKVNSISDFQALEFYVPAGTTSRDTMLTVTSADADTTGVKSIKVKGGAATGSQLTADSTISLLTATESTDVIVPAGCKITADITGTGLMKIDGTVIKAGNSIVFKANGDIKGLAEESKSYAETRAGGMAFLNSAADMAVGKGFMSAQAAAEADGNNGTSTGGFTPYAAVGAANMTYETGSYVDSKGWGINVGFSRIINSEKSKLTLAPFIEYGKANYDSYLENDVNTHGSGDNSFTGIGFMAKNEQKNGFYYEGSVRLGRSKGDYQGDASTYDSKYDTASNYLAFHAGIGKVQKLNDKSSLDYYGKLFYTHQNGDTVNIQSTLGPSSYDFDAINSYRLRLGTRWNQKLSAREIFYAGLAWDYEFDSEARAHYNGFSTPAPSMKGSSGMLEVGWKQEATKENPIGVDVGLTGWCGKQRGVSFNAGFSWAF